MRVIKLGGSLLDLPDLRDRLSLFLNELQPRLPSLVLVGGGGIVEAVRAYNRLWQLNETDCHWLSVRLMNSTANLLKLLFPDWALIESPLALADWLSQAKNEILDQSPQSELSSAAVSSEKSGILGTKSKCQPAIVAPDAFYSPVLNSDALPKNWDTTSDSISALLARLVEAEELILLKSTLAPSEPFLATHRPESVGTLTAETGRETAQRWVGRSSQDLVDKGFLTALPACLRWQVVNLRRWAPTTSIR